MRFIAGLAASLSLCLSGVASAAPAQSYIVLVAGDSPRTTARNHGVAPDFVYEHALKGSSATLAPEAAAALTRSPRILSVTPDITAHIVGQTTPIGLERIGGPGAQLPPITVGIAIIDTGIGGSSLSSVPDLNVAGRVVCTKGKAGAPGSCAPGGVDDNNHGTHVAGTAAAIDNGIGVIGVAPGAPLYAVKVCGRSGTCDLSAIIAGLDWVASMAPTIRVANMSLGWTGTADTAPCATTTNAFHKAVCGTQAAGVTIVAAAGNETDDASNHLPGAYPEVITVSALNDADGVKAGDFFASFSNYGPVVDIIAPGVNILSTLPDGTLGSYSGTSMATPHVTGAAARILQENPTFGPADVAAALIADADPLPCPTADGHCANDPDNETEPGLWIGAPIASCDTDADCADGTLCSAAGACVEPMCVTDLDCDDADACTIETCVGGGTALATCQSDYAACGDADACCGPTCSGNTQSVAYDLDCPTAAAWCQVADIQFVQGGGSKSYNLKAYVHVEDTAGNPVAGATITVQSQQGTRPPIPATVTTDANGVAKVLDLISNISDPMETEVLGVSHATLGYDEIGNVETCSRWDVRTKIESACQ